MRRRNKWRCRGEGCSTTTADFATPRVFFDLPTSADGRRPHEAVRPHLPHHLTAKPFWDNHYIEPRSIFVDPETHKSRDGFSTLAALP